MVYTVALLIAAKAATCLQDDEGSMSEKELAVHVSALFLALKAIARSYHLQRIKAIRIQS